MNWRWSIWLAAVVLSTVQIAADSVLYRRETQGNAEEVLRLRQADYSKANNLLGPSDPVTA